MRKVGRRLALGLAAALTIGLSGIGGNAAAATEVSVMTMNIWHTDSTGELDAVVDQIRASGANVVALQETSTQGTTKIADALGWEHTPTGWDIDVISALPIEATDWKSWNDSGAQAIAAKIAGVWFYSVHLDYTKYGPYNACFDHDSKATILADEANRKLQASQIAEWTGSSPAILAGDLNSPSHQDWTAATRSQHCGYAVEWPTTRAFTDRGFTDSFREIHPDPAATPGNTWSPKVKYNDDYGKPEPQDRIDYIMYRGDGITVNSSRTYGGNPDWPSDHLAVVTDFTLS